MDIGHKLKELRIAKGLSLGDVSEKIEVSKTTLMRWESGETQKMPSKKIEPLAKVLGISPMYIVLGEEEYLTREQPTERELVNLFRTMTIKQRTKLLSYAYELLEENNQ